MNINAIAGIVAVLAMLAGLQTCRLESAQEKIVTLESTVKAAAEANETTQASLDTAIAAASACVEGREADKLENAEALRRLTIEKQTIAEALAQAKRDREAEYENDADCRAWADAPVCPVAEHSLRTRAAGSH